MLADFDDKFDIDEQQRGRAIPIPDTRPTRIGISLTAVRVYLLVPAAGPAEDSGAARWRVASAHY